MPCEKCDTKLIFDNGIEKCPGCDDYNILPYDDAIIIAERRFEYLNSLFQQAFREFEKNALIAHVVWQREKYARDFFERYQPFQIDKFATYTLLLYNLMNNKGFIGEVEADENNTKFLIDSYTKFLNLSSDLIYLNEGFSVMISKGPFDIEDLEPPTLLGNFKTVPTEDYLPVKKSFEYVDILSEKEAEEKMEIYKRDFEILGPKDVPAKNYSTDEFIETLYPFLLQAHVGLFRNILFSRTFNFNNFVRLGATPKRLIRFVNSFILDRRGITITNKNEFVSRATGFFKNREKIIERELIFKEGNSKIFPLFVQLDDHIFISHRTSFLIQCILHTIFYKDKFDAETQKRSHEFEKNETKKEFEKHGFQYFSDLKDKKKKPTLQIDGIATNDILWVVECKGSRIKTFLEHKKRQEELERDIKGYIDGVKYTTKNGKLVQRKVPSLLEKVEFTKNKMEIWGFDKTKFSDVRGVLVSRFYPPIEEYKGIEVIPLENIKSLEKS